jgi:glycosyltransferase involved in cell wall biosynthesis
VGSMNFWFDVEAVEFAARAHPEWRFVLVGQVATGKLEKLRKLANVQFTGEMPYEALAGQLQRMDVAMIPFLRLPLTMATNPIKLYEYFACGLPVVSTRLPEVEVIGDGVYLADTAAEFTRQLEAAMVENNSELRQRRMRLAWNESWLARCRQLEDEMARVEHGVFELVRQG